MFVKIYEYHIQKGKIENYLNLQKRANHLYSKYLDGHTIYLKSAQSETKWLEISTYKDEATYQQGIKLVNSNSEIGKLFEQFESYLEEKREIKEENYDEILRINRGARK